MKIKSFFPRWINHYQNLSLKWKVPLRSIVLVTATAITLSSVLIYQTIQQMQSQFETYAANITRDFANALAYPVLYRDTWKVYEFLTQLSNHDSNNNNLDLIKYKNLLILNPDMTVFASNHPDHYPLLSKPTTLPLFNQLKQLNALNRQVVRVEETETSYFAAPIVNTNEITGYFVMELDKTPLKNMFYHYWQSTLLLIILILGLLLLITFYWAKKIAQPLVTLSDCLNAKPTNRLQLQSSCQIQSSQDEIGQLIQSVQTLLATIERAAHFEREAFHQERFAALGRMAAGVAHEVNNPLGGMLNAIHNYRQCTQPNEQMLQQTLALLERGLKQIQHTVSSLLVQAKYDSRNLTCQDFEDVLSLLAKDIKTKQIKIRFQQKCAITHLNNLPAHPVRQVLINLLLNAIKASPKSSEVVLNIYEQPQQLIIEVENQGTKIPHHQLETLFEPDFKAGDTKRQGFGLWICYQLVTQLGGDITVTSEEKTTFKVILPIEEADKIRE